MDDLALGDGDVTEEFCSALTAAMHYTDTHTHTQMWTNICYYIFTLFISFCLTLSHTEREETDDHTYSMHLQRVWEEARG